MPGDSCGLCIFHIVLPWSQVECVPLKKILSLIIGKMMRPLKMCQAGKPAGRPFYSCMFVLTKCFTCRALCRERQPINACTAWTWHEGTGHGAYRGFLVVALHWRCVSKIYHTGNCLQSFMSLCHHVIMSLCRHVFVSSLTMSYHHYF